MTTTYIDTNYHRTVSQTVRSHTESLMGRWREEGRDDQDIESLVRSVVLYAYSEGRFAGLREVENFVNERSKQ